MRKLATVAAVLAIFAAGCTTVEPGRGTMAKGTTRTTEDTERNRVDTTERVPAPDSVSVHPNTESDEPPPVRPPDVYSVAGAEAFARYYVKALNWAVATRDTSLMRAAFDARTCSSCVVFADALDELRLLQVEIRGGRETLTDLVQSVPFDLADHFWLIVLDREPVQYFDERGNLLQADPARLDFTALLEVAFRDGRWVIRDLIQIA